MERMLPGVGRQVEWDIQNNRILFNVNGDFPGKLILRRYPDGRIDMSVLTDKTAERRHDAVDGPRFGGGLAGMIPVD